METDCARETSTSTTTTTPCRVTDGPELRLFYLRVRRSWRFPIWLFNFDAWRSFLHRPRWLGQGSIIQLELTCGLVAGGHIMSLNYGYRAERHMA